MINKVYPNLKIEKSFLDKEIICGIDEVGRGCLAGPVIAAAVILDYKNIPKGINVVARSFDGLPEAIYIDEQLHPFMIAVQFHPERLGNDNPIHKRMRKSFLDAVKLNH